MERLNAFVARVDRAGMADSLLAVVASTNRLLLVLTGVRPLRPDSARAGDAIVARIEP